MGNHDVNCSFCGSDLRTAGMAFDGCSNLKQAEKCGEFIEAKERKEKKKEELPEPSEGTVDTYTAIMAPLSDKVRAAVIKNLLRENYELMIDIADFCELTESFNTLKQMEKACAESIYNLERYLESAHKIAEVQRLQKHIAECVDLDLDSALYHKDQAEVQLSRCRDEVQRLQTEINEALQLTESCSTLKQMAEACIKGAYQLSRYQAVVEAAQPFGKASTSADYVNAPDNERHWQCYVSAREIGALRQALANLPKKDEND